MIRLYFILFLFFAIRLNSQSELGTTLLDSEVFEGYTLFTVHKRTFLINNCGQLINEWTSEYLPGNAVYLLPNGSIVRAGRTNDDNPITFGGIGGIVEIFSWEGELIWSYNFSGDGYRQHHDIYPLPNNNILILLATSLDYNSAINLGRDPNKLIDNELYNEQILEVEPIGSNQINIVWEWNIMDHVIQDFDDNKENFGIIAQNPYKLNINFLNGFSGGNNWLHVNSIQYNEDEDLIVISSRNLSEFWVIDHSTTTEEAASGAGGNRGRGGDFLYRWGNPQSYDNGTESSRILFGQHMPYIISNDLPNARKIIYFNNGFGRSPLYSEVQMIDPPFDENGDFIYDPPNGFGPETVSYSYPENPPIEDSSFFSAIVSSAQQLQNGNILICEGFKGKIFELNSNDEKVWEYNIPINNQTGLPFSPNLPQELTSFTFRATKYSKDYQAFNNKELVPGDVLELGSVPIENCSDLLTNSSLTSKGFNIYPNPSSNSINIESREQILTMEVYSTTGKLLKIAKFTNRINIYDLSEGLYLLRINTHKGVYTSRIIKN